MTADIDNSVLEQLRAIRADSAELKSHAGSTNLQLASMGQQIGALTTAVYGGHSELEELRRRLERVERRLELVDN
jgi:chromosome segregation ATPase